MLLEEEISELLNELDYDIDNTTERLDYVINLLEKYPTVLDMYLSSTNDDANTKLSKMFEQLDDFVYEE